MSQRTPRRPQRFSKPAHWSDVPPPAPEAGEAGAEKLSPTRYGDWVRKGIAVDF